MGFPNVDLILRDLFIASFLEARMDTAEIVADLFDDRSYDEQRDIADYLTSRTFTGNIRDRGDEKRVFILPHFPTSELPFPQIGIYHGESSGNDRFLGDVCGDLEPVYDDDGETVRYYREPHGYLETASWNIDVIAVTKDEVIWLSRFCQYFICQNFKELSAKGIMEINISLADLRPAQGALQPLEAFVRGVKVTARTTNTWSKKIATSNYQTGINTAL